MKEMRNKVSAKPRIGITIGDPGGIGAEIVLKAVASEELLNICTPCIIGDAQYLSHWADVFNLPPLTTIVNDGDGIPPNHNAIDLPFIYHINNISGQSLSDYSSSVGVVSADNGKAAAQYIETAVKLTMAGELDAIATAPINKESLALAGYPYPGHTEFLAKLTNTSNYAMVFISPILRVALLTIHVALNDVSALVKKSELIRLIELMNRELKSYGFQHPRIAVAGLNPHAGENGMFGKEEINEMRPAIAGCRSTGINVEGPYPADTLFVRAARGEFDIVISCYHDQGLIPIKCLSFGEAVNCTFGLPIIRTSVDHGTAFDIAGKGIAEHSSMIAAIKLAAELVQQRRQEI